MAAKKKKAPRKAAAEAPAKEASGGAGREMKLAEALLLRSDMQKRLTGLRERVVANAVVQEGETPQEDPKALLLEAVGVLEDLERIVARINRTNLTARLPDGRTLTEAIARRDKLAQQHSLYKAAIDGCRKEPDRYSVREIKWIASLEVSRLQKQCDDLARDLREINGAIQETNWKVELGA